MEITRNGDEITVTIKLGWSCDNCGSETEPTVEYGGDLPTEILLWLTLPAILIVAYPFAFIPLWYSWYRRYPNNHVCPDCGHKKPVRYRVTRP